MDVVSRPVSTISDRASTAENEKNHKKISLFSDFLKKLTIYFKKDLEIKK